MIAVQKYTLSPSMLPIGNTHEKKALVLQIQRVIEGMPTLEPSRPPNRIPIRSAPPTAAQVLARARRPGCKTQPSRLSPPKLRPQDSLASAPAERSWNGRLCHIRYSLHDNDIQIEVKMLGAILHGVLAHLRKAPVRTQSRKRVRHHTISDEHRPQQRLGE